MHPEVSIETHDVAVIGGGIVGLATARAIAERDPAARLIVLEKEARVGAHQTSHNSGVVHAGLYYKPGSFKARLTVEGRERMLHFCRERNIAVEHCGKVVVATESEELPRLETLAQRGVANGVVIEEISLPRLKEIEPHAAAIRALWSPTTAIVDYQVVADAIARELTAGGAQIVTGARVVRIDRDQDGIRIGTSGPAVRARHLVNCAGLYSDEIARMAGVATRVRIIPFRGEYYMIRPERRSLVRGLIYPVPDPSFPFLGVHLTKTVHGEVEAGPNAVLAFAREGYEFAQVHLAELAGTLGYSGFWRLAGRHWRMGAFEMMRSLRKGAFVQALQRLVPDLRPEDVERGGAGVRAQAVDPDGSLVDDFRIVTEADAIHVLNAPSPAATASLAIGRHIAAQAEEAFGLAARN